jgi:hypothetical protein
MCGNVWKRAGMGGRGGHEIKGVSEYKSTQDFIAML